MALVVSIGLEMSKFENNFVKNEIKESKKLYGSVKVSGAKNAVLPLMAASILNKKKS